MHHESKPWVWDVNRSDMEWISHYYTCICFSFLDADMNMDPDWMLKLLFIFDEMNSGRDQIRMLVRY